MALLNCSKRTIQNYYHPAKRDPVKWHYLELTATNRILPQGFTWYNGRLGTDTGYDYSGAELSQWSFFQSMKNAQIAQLEQKIDDLKQENHELKARLAALDRREVPKPKGNVINFRPRKTLTQMET